MTKKEMAKQVGNHIKIFRTNAKMSQKELAEKSDLTPAGISMIEKGIRLPNLFSYFAISTALTVSMDHLFYGKPEEFISISICDKMLQDMADDIIAIVKKSTV